MKKYIILAGLFLLFLFCLQNGLFAQAGSDEAKQAIMIDDDEEQIVTITGFIDLEYKDRKYKSKNNMASAMGLTEGGKFSQNYLNLYFTLTPVEGWKGFAEIRFLYSPSGKTTSAYVDTDGDGVVDSLYTEPFDNNATDNQTNQFKYGSIHIERAYVEWNTISHATIRFGRYLTPFGIWSQDHGAPVITSIRVPLLVNPPTAGLVMAGMPQTQTGVELLGKVHLGDLMVDYAAYYGNGISDNDAMDDGDKNKAFGGFLNFTLLSMAKIIDIELGCSGYRGERTHVKSRTISLIPYLSSDFPMIAVGLDPSSSLKTLSAKQNDTIALAHFRISIGSLPFDGAFVLQGEGMRQWVDEIDDDRVDRGADLLMSQLTGLDVKRQAEDYKVDLYYIQAEYHLWGIVTPFFRWEYGKIGSKDPQALLMLHELSGYMAGLNIKPVRNVTLKTELTRLRSSSPFNTNLDLDYFQASVVLAF